MTYPVIDVKETGKRIKQLRCQKNMSVRVLQELLGLEEPQAIYKWERGDNIPKIENLVILSVILGEPIDNILVYR